MPLASSMTSTGGISALSPYRFCRPDAFSGAAADAPGCRVRRSFIFQLLSSLDVDAARLRRGAPLDRDLQHAVAVLGLDGVRIGVVGQADDAAELAGTALVDMH